MPDILVGQVWEYRGFGKKQVVRVTEVEAGDSGDIIHAMPKGGIKGMLLAADELQEEGTLLLDE